MKTKKPNVKPRKAAKRDTKKPKEEPQETVVDTAPAPVAKKAKEVNVSDSSLFNFLIEDLPKPKKAMMHAAPTTFMPSRAQTESLALNWDAAIASVVKLLAALGLPFDVASLKALRVRVSASKWPAFMVRPLVAAIDVLIGDEELLKAHAAPYVGD